MQHLWAFVKIFLLSVNMQSCKFSRWLGLRIMLCHCYCHVLHIAINMPIKYKECGDLVSIIL